MTPAPDSAGADSARCFLALLPDAPSRDASRRCRETLERLHASAARGMRWLDDASLHLTLRFLGQTPGAQAEYLKHMLPTLAHPLPVVATRRLAIWPNRARPRTLVLELEAPDALLALARDCESLAQKSGFDPETRPFRAHLTLARLRPGCALGIPPAPLPTLAFESLALMASDLQAAGARYRALAQEPLPAARNS